MGWTPWRTGRWYPTALRLISSDPGPGAPRRRTGAFPAEAIGTHAGLGGCAAEVAAEYGEHPETAARRMRWARAVVDGINADWGAFLGRRTRESL